MAELALTAFAAMGSAGTAAVGLTAAETAAAVASAGAGAASWAAGTTVAGAGLLGSGALGALSTGLTVAGAASSLLGGFMGYRQAQGQAAVAEINADQARLDAEEKAVRIRRELVQKVGQARVAFAGSGLDISSGQAIEAGYKAEADFETSLARTSGEMGAAGQRMAAASYRTRGYAGIIEGAGRAAGGLFQNQISIARRG